MVNCGVADVTPPGFIEYERLVRPEPAGAFTTAECPMHTCALPKAGAIIVNATTAIEIPVFIIECFTVPAYINTAGRRSVGSTLNYLYATPSTALSDFSHIDRNPSDNRTLSFALINFVRSPFSLGSNSLTLVISK